MLRIGVPEIDARKFGTLNVDRVYNGADLVWPILPIGGQAHLTSTSTLTARPSVTFSGKASLTSTSELSATPKINGVIDGSATLISTSTLSATPYIERVQFEMYVASVLEPEFKDVVGGTLTVIEVTTGSWKVSSVHNITSFKFDDLSEATPTEINIITGATLTSMNNMCYRTEFLTDFTFQGECNVTDGTGAWLYCSKLVNWSFSDTSSIVIFNGMFGNCTSLQHVPYMDTSSGTTFQTMYNNCTSLICITNVNTTLITESGDSWYMFNGCTSLLAPSLIEQDAITDYQANGDDWTNSNPCPADLSEPPEYLLTEPIITLNGRYYVDNSSTSGSIYDGDLQHASQSTFPVGTPWLPSNAQYPEDGTIQLDVAAGDGVRQIDTQWIPPSDSEWTFKAVYDVVVGVSYKMYAIHYKGNGLCDIYVGDNINGFPLTPNYTDVPYTPPTASWKILKDPPSVIDNVTEIEYTMTSFTTI